MRLSSTTWLVLVLAALSLALTVSAGPAAAQSTENASQSDTVVGQLDRQTEVLEVGATKGGDWYMIVDAERRTSLELVDCMVGLKHDGAKCNVVEQRVGEGRQKVTMDAVEVDGMMYVCAYTPRSGKAGWCAPAETGWQFDPPEVPSGPQYLVVGSGSSLFAFAVFWWQRGDRRRRWEHVDPDVRDELVKAMPGRGSGKSEGSASSPNGGDE